MSRPLSVDGVNIVDTIKSGDLAKLTPLSDRLREEKPFLYSVLQDTLKSACANSDKRKRLDVLAEVASIRIRSLSDWEQAGNETVEAIEAGQIDADEIKPHVRFESTVYDEYYGDQSDRQAAKAARLDSLNEDKDFVSLGLHSNVNHSFRYSHAISVVENLIGIIAAMEQKKKEGSSSITPASIRWMDIGCGTGDFANAVNPARFGSLNWEIVGCDMQPGKIAVAEKRKARGRQFFASDAFRMLEDYRAKGEYFDLVSMFEFLEHLDDPLKFIRQLDTFRPKFLLAASPLAQKLNKPRDTKQDRVHLWSFSRRSWEQMFKLAGFEVVYSSEVRVGTYIGGLDWLSVVCGPVEELHAARQSLSDLRWSS